MVQGVLKKTTTLKLFDRFPPSEILKNLLVELRLQLMNWWVTNMKNNLIMCMIS